MWKMAEEGRNNENTYTEMRQFNKDFIGFHNPKVSIDIFNILAL